MPEETKKKVEMEIQEALAVNTDDLAGELKEQPSTFFYWSCMWALAARKRRHQKIALKEVEAKLGRRFKESLRAEDPKIRVSERMLDDYLAEQSEYQEVLQAYTQAEYTESMLEVAKDSFKQRGQMLIELSRTHGDDRYQESAYRAMAGELEKKDEKKLRKRTKRTEEDAVTTEQTI
jgi:hypothetical protein